MWFSLNLNDKNYILKSFSDDEIFSVHCSDFENIWVENLKTNDICNRFQLLNNVEMPALKLKSKLHSLFYENRDDSNFVLQNGENNILDLKLRTKLSNKDIEMNFHLQKETTAYFSQEVVLPLCFSLILMKNTEEKLIDIIKDKDMELKEHKLSGHFIENKKLVTPTFNETNLKNSIDDSMVNLFSNSQFVENLKKINICDNSGNQLSENEKSDDDDDDVTTSNDLLLTSKIKRRKKPKRGQRKRYRQL